MKRTVDKKVHKKQTKALNIVKKDFDIEICEEESCNILICNAGLMTGTSREDLLQVMESCGKVDNIIMLPRKSYSFVVFKSKQDSQRAMEELNGKVCIHDTGPLFLVTVNRVPTVEDPWSVGPPPGLLVIPQFINVEEEKSLLEMFASIYENTKDSSGELKNRKVQHFGYEFDYTSNSIDASKPISRKIPDDCYKLMERMVAAELIPEVGDQLTANLYLPGQGIPPHTDSHSCCTDWLCSLSLGSAILMELKDPQGKVSPVWLPQRSLLVLKDESRYTWKHGITPRHSDIVPSRWLQKDSIAESKEDGLTLFKRETRLSLTFRKSRRGECECIYLDFCDRERNDKVSTESLEVNASEVESRMVHQVYEEIASHFSETRHKPWPRVVEFIQSLPFGGVLVDVGCGNGKYLGIKEGLVEIGSDFSHNLLKIVVDRGYQGVRSDMLRLGFKDQIASGIICIAVLHHLSTSTRRLSAIQEMTRLLERKGRLLIYVWAFDQKKVEMSSYLKQNKNNFKKDVHKEAKQQFGEFGLPVHTNRTNFEHQDVLVPWKLKSADEKQQVKTFQRFYHVFQEGELEDLLNAAGGLDIVESYYDQGNWCCICEKN